MLQSNNSASPCDKDLVLSRKKNLRRDKIDTHKKTNNQNTKWMGPLSPSSWPKSAFFLDAIWPLWAYHFPIQHDMLAWAYMDGNRLGLALLCVCAPTTNSRLAPYLCIHACPCYYQKLTYRRCNSSIHLVLKHFACVTFFWAWVGSLPGLKILSDRLIQSPLLLVFDGCDS